MLLVNRNFARLWAGQAVSRIGDYVFDTTLALWVGTVLLKDRPYAPAALAALALCVSVAILVVGPLAGVFVDRWDQRRTMLGADLIRAGLVGALTVVAFLPTATHSVPLTLAAIYATVLLTSVAAQFFNPARFGVFGDIVPGEADQARAMGIVQATGSVAAIIGPPLAAPLLFTVGLQWALLLNALSFLVSFVAVRSVRMPPARPRPAAAAVRSGVWPELLGGLQVVGRSGFIRAMLVTVVIVTLGTAPLNTLGVFFVKEALHADTKLYGTLAMGEGIGSIAGALVAGTVAARIGSARVIWLGLVLSGLGLGVYALLTNLAAAVIVVALIGVPIAAINTALGPIMLKATPREYLGRVVSILNPTQQVAVIVSAAASGWLASTVLLGFHASVGPVQLGRIDTIYLGSAVLILAGGVYAAFALRGANRPA